MGSWGNDLPPGPNRLASKKAGAGKGRRPAKERKAAEESVIMEIRVL